MNNNSYFITAFGTFGNPNGFRQSYWFTKDKIIVNSIKTFDLNTNAIKLFPRSKVYAIRKEFAGDYNIISYSVYTYAKEQNSERSGTFIGSGILFTNKISEEYLVVNQLNEFHESLVEKNIENDAIIVSHSDKLSITKPRDFDKIGFQLKPVEDLNFIPASNKYLVVFCDISAEKLRLYFKKAPDLLNVYDTIYFTDSREVAEFVNQKGIFKLIQNVGEKRDFELEIQNLHEERTRKRESSISEFEREIQKLEDDKIRTLGDFNEQIAHNEKLHQANEIILRQSRSDLEKVEQIYSDFSSKIKEQANQLRSGRRLDEVKNIYNENKRRFFDAVTQFKKPDFINKISKAAAKPGFRPENRFRQEEGELSQNKSKGRNEAPRINIFKVATPVLLLLLIGTWAYFLFFKGEEESKPVQTDQQKISALPDSIPQQVIPIAFQELSPKPNSKLNENDCRNVAKKLKYDIVVDDIVKIIFSLNPTDIEGSYTGQEANYGKRIIELNKNCFEERDGVLRFSRDTLRYIPAFRQEK